MTNPYEASVSTERASRSATSVAVARALMCALPLWSYAFVWVFAIVASTSLGHWVQPGVDDPKDVFWGIPMAIHLIMQTFAFALVPAALVMVSIKPANRHFHYQLIYIVSFGIALFLFRLNVGQLTTWLAD